MTSHDELIDFYRTYAPSFDTDIPLYAGVCRELGQHPEVVELLIAHEPDAQQPNLLFAAVHYLVLAGADHELARVYGGAPVANSTALFADFVLGNRSAVNELLATQRTQTNEVGRAAFLALMLQDAQRRSGQRLAWIDLGASGGLNLNVDRFHIDYVVGGDVTSIGPESPVELKCEIRSGHPPVQQEHADIGWRMGVDRAPIDVTDPDQARWLQACVWPTQTDRHARLEAAISIATTHPPRVLAADAADGIAAAIAEAPADLALVMTTTWVWYYLPVETQAAVLDTLRNCGRPVWWYSLEGEGVVPGVGPKTAVTVERSQLGVVEFGGAESGSRAQEPGELLAAGHPHGAWLEWR